MDKIADERLDRFVELVPEDVAGATVFRVVRGRFLFFAEGDLIRVDPHRCEIDYLAYFVTEIGRRYFLAGLGSRETRPKDGKRGLRLRSSWAKSEQEAFISDEAFIPIISDGFSRICRGRIVGCFEPREAESGRMSAAEQEVLLQPFDTDQREEEKAERAREEAARAAGWRGRRHTSEKLAGFRDPNADVHAPEGTYDIDTVVRRLLNQGRILYFHTDQSNLGELAAFVSARSFALSFSRIAFEQAKFKIERWPQNKLDARQIVSRVERMLDDINGFLEHVDFETSALFISASVDPPDDEEEPLEWAYGVASNRLACARTSLEDSRNKLRT